MSSLDSVKGIGIIIIIIINIGIAHCLRERKKRGQGFRGASLQIRFQHVTAHTQRFHFGKALPGIPLMTAGNEKTCM